VGNSNLHKWPAFQFYPKDFISDVLAMDGLENEEIGIYMRLLCYEWVGMGLPTDEKKLLRMAGIAPNAVRKREKMKRILSLYFEKTSKVLLKDFAKTLDVSSKYFQSDEEVYINPRLQKERFKLLERKKIAKKAANARWDGEGEKKDADASITHCPAVAVASASSLQQQLRARGFIEEVKSLRPEFGDIRDDSLLRVYQDWGSAEGSYAAYCEFKQDAAAPEKAPKMPGMLRGYLKNSDMKKPGKGKSDYTGQDWGGDHL